MKRIIAIFMALGLALAPVMAQESKEEYLRKYNNLVERVGPDGIGVETLLNKWEAAWPEDPFQMVARFSFCFTRSRTSHVEQMDRDRYLGDPPILPMTDSLGNKRNFFEVYDFDEDLFAQANSSIGKAIAARQNRLNWRLYKVNALMAYEKESPEMALQELKGIVDFNYTRKPDWEHEQIEGTVSQEQFEALMQDYCVTFFRIGSDQSKEAFKALSEHILKYSKDNSLFLNNMGSYYLVKRDFKKARKYIDQVLKKHPDDATALQNGIIMARSQKDEKLEKKYRAMKEKAQNE